MFAVNDCELPLGRGWHDSVGSWLYATAYRISLKARSLAARRQRREGDSLNTVTAAAPQATPHDDTRPVLDEELNRLPENYRRPVVLCYLEGKTHA